MDLSLDEIIKRKKIGGNAPKKRPFIKQPIKTLSKNIQRPMDARNKIIQKNRAKIRDAREKLAHITKTSGDARLKLQRRRKDFPINVKNKQKKPMKREFQNKKSMVAPKYSGKLPVPVKIGVPRGYVDYDNMDVEEEYEPTSVALRRTVHNDIPPPFAPYKIDRGPSGLWSSDPFDCYEIPVARAPDVPDPVHLRRQIRNMSPDILPPKGILRSSRQTSPPLYSSRRYLSEQASHLSYEMRNRLERAPDPHTSMGIFANPLKPASSSTSGCRIVVSNLHSSVTQGDIKELFEDIGELYETRLVRPGVAEVIFKSMKDAEKAVDTYHNRQLDGQPMKCLLVNPRASNKLTAPAIKPSSGAGNYNSSSKSPSKFPLEIDIDALHKVLFRRN